MAWERARRELFGRGWSSRLKALAVAVVVGWMAGTNVVGVLTPPIKAIAFWAIVGGLGAVVSGYLRAGIVSSLLVVVLATLGADGTGLFGATHAVSSGFLHPPGLLFLGLPSAIAVGLFGHAIGEYIVGRSANVDPTDVGRCLIGENQVPVGPVCAHLGVVLVAAVAVGSGAIEWPPSLPVGVGFAVVVLSLPLWVATRGGGLAHCTGLLVVPVCVATAFDIVTTFPGTDSLGILARMYWNLGYAALIGAALYILARVGRWICWQAGYSRSQLTGESPAIAHESMDGIVGSLSTSGVFKVALASTLLVFLFVVPATPILEPAHPVDQETRIQLETGTCFGGCPVYSITVYGNGTVHYVGHEETRVRGHERYSIPRRQFRQLLHAVYRTDFFRMESEHSVPVTDRASATVTVSMSGHTKSVYEYGHAGPDRLHVLQEEIAAVAGNRIN